MEIPEWLATAAVGAVIAALGYVSKLAIEGWQALRQRRRGYFASLVQLESLLRASRVSFRIQREHRNRLHDLIRANHPEVPADGGFEREFSLAYPKFSPEEKQLHELIRSITINSMKPANDEISSWLKNDTYFKAQRQRDGTRTTLAKKLADLEAHLILWHAKYPVWIPDHPEHALVYMVDEERHGLGFPPQTDETVESALEAFRA